MDLLSALSNNTHAKILYDEPMRKHTSYGVGGNARFYTEVDSLYTLNEVVTFAKENRLPYKILGNGTNVLVSDNGYNGIIICTIKLSDVFFVRDEIHAMAGASLYKLIKFAREHRLSGLESLSGIPATVGGAVVMNAGAFGHNISDKITTVETLSNGKIKKYYKDECNFNYRGSRFLGKKEVIISANFKLKESDREIITAGIKSFSDLRNSIQPSGRSCGSVFKNPRPETAGRLIDKAGLKGLTIGGASVSERHGNFITTAGRATATDVYELVQYIKKKIKDEFGIELKEEVEFVGEF
ncbi:MAG: UDP-N-acetylmuramate dehydrogenase [Clostridia bacterium]|nr:UDP-N-acetylmuramate dehydrogenase [Clostridia bacterium]